MKQSLLILIFCFSISCFSKEWKNFRHFQKESGRSVLTASDWLKSDRKQNSLVWQQANSYNLNNNLPEEYVTIKHRRDFYLWYYSELDKKGHDVIWPKMAHFISTKLRLTKVFPFSVFIKKTVKKYTYQGSERVFNQSFKRLKNLFNSETILKASKAENWDQETLYQEQYFWIETIYKIMDSNSLKTIECMAKGKGFYKLMVSREIRFQGDVSKAEERYNYAINPLYNYCKNTYK